MAAAGWAPRPLLRLLPQHCDGDDRQSGSLQTLGELRTPRIHGNAGIGDQDIDCLARSRHHRHAIDDLRKFASVSTGCLR